jgi:hypothetical protein
MCTFALISTWASSGTSSSGIAIRSKTLPSQKKNKAARVRERAFSQYHLEKMVDVLCTLHISPLCKKM